jgi:hypothetical protein
VIERGGEQPPVVLPADQAETHEAKLHAQAAQYDTRHHRKSRESTRRLLILIRDIEEKHKNPLYCTSGMRNTKRVTVENHENPPTHTCCEIRYAATKRKSRGSKDPLHCKL